MPHSLLHYFCVRLPVMIGGEPHGHPTGAREGRRIFASGRRSGRGASGPRRSRNLFIVIWAAAAMLWQLAAQPAAHAAVQGDLIVNNASFLVNGVTVVSTSVTVSVVPMRTSSTIQFLEYAAPSSDGSLPAGATPVNVAQGWYRTGSGANATFAAEAPPTPLGSSAPLDLGNPIPLVPATSFHAGEPIFVQVTDPDHNLDRTSRDTIVTTITDKTTGQTEVLRLTETGPDTGVFVGYLNTTTATGSTSTASYKGLMPVGQGNAVGAQYVDSADNSDSTTAAVVVDPYGIVFDSRTGAPVDSATVTLWDVDKNAPAIVYGDDGVSSFPSTLTTGKTITVNDSKGRPVTYDAHPGGYRFPYILPGHYQLKVTPPMGYVAPSTATAAALASVPGGPFSIVNGSFGKTFAVDPGPSIRIDIPADPAYGKLWIQKQAGKSQVAPGDFLPYQLNVLNSDASNPASSVKVGDLLPLGFRYRKGSTKLNELPVADPAISADGRTLTWSVGDLASKASVTLSYVVEISAGAAMGTAINVASASSGSHSSNVASAQVEVKSDFLSSRALILGRVYSGSCGEEARDEKGIAGVRLFMEDGTFVDTDKNGLYHFEGVTANSHVVQLDLDSLPAGYEALPCEQNSRFAGSAYSQFVDLQGGTMWRADFHLARAAKQAKAGEHEVSAPVPEPPAAKPEPQPEAPAQPPGATVGIDLKSAFSGERGIEYQVRSWGGAEKLSGKKLSVTLPSGLVYLPKSSELNGKLVGDPAQKGSTLVYTLPDTSDDWIGILRLNAEFAAAGSEGDLLTKAVLDFDTPDAKGLSTPVADNVLTRVRSENRVAMPDVVLHPHFPTFGTELSAEDRAELDDLARMLMVLAIDRITISGHTDNVRISPRARRIFADNKALSFARAKSVGRYLCEKLHLPPERMEYFGQGEAQPIASNKSAKGRAQNRRVEIRVQAARLVAKDVVELKKGQSGLQQTEIVRPLPPQLRKAKMEVKPAEPVKKVEVKEPEKKDEPEIEAPAEQPGIKDADGVLSPAEGSMLIFPINGVRICLNSSLTPKLSVDGKEVPAERIGFTMKDTKSGKAIYSYIGVDFGRPGEHVVLLEGLDPFGIARYQKSAKVIRSGEISGLRLKSAAGNVADGKTPVKLQVELLDASGHVVAAAADLEVKEGELKPWKEKGIMADPPKSGEAEKVHVDAQGNVLFQPVSRSGLYHVVLALNGVKLEADTYLKPALRDWILVGMGEGSAGYNTIAGHMESVQGTGIDEKLYNDGRVAFYAKGTVKGEWLLTAAYDSAKQTNVNANGLFQNIDPNTYYTLYGDASQQQYDASSSLNKLYLKIERDQFYALFGDYDTGLTVTELSRYTRKLNGVKSELHTKNLDLVAFGSQTGQAYAKDEIQGDGTSGIYHLSHKGIVINSDTVTIEVRDRFRSEIVISSRQLSRFTDYSIDYDGGTLLFNEPIYSRDDQFNQIYIVAQYETQNGGSAITAGGRAGVKLLDDRVKAGVTYIHEGQATGSGESIGLDTTLKLTDTTTLKAEAAHTSSTVGTSVSGNAYLVELDQKTAKLDSRLYFRDIGNDFGMGQQQGSEIGTRKMGLDAAYKLSDAVTMNGTTSRENNLSTGGQRDLMEARANYSEGNYGANLGFRYANDDFGQGNKETSEQITFGATSLLLDKKLTLKANRDQSIGSGNNVDYPTRTTFGAEYKLTEKASVFAEQEFTQGGSSQTNMTRGGLKTSPWQGGTVNSSMEHDLNENQDRLFALFGLKQTWKINDRWSVDGGLDRSQTLKNSYLFNANVPPVSGAAEDFTAVSLGAAYKQTTWSWDGRGEVRRATSEDKWGVMSSLLGEPKPGWGWSARLQLFDTKASTQDTLNGDLRFGLVYRPQQTHWIILDRLDFLLNQTKGTAGSFVATSPITTTGTGTPVTTTESGTVITPTPTGLGTPGMSTDTNDRRVVNNLNANYQPNKKLQLSIQYGAKYVLETVDYNDYSGYTDLIGLEGRYDLTTKWDVGMRGSLLHSWATRQLQESAGLSVGYNVVQNAWLSVGYNVVGFNDRDFSAANYTAQGPYLRFRFKFDQNSVRDAVKWLNQL